MYNLQLTGILGDAGFLLFLGLFQAIMANLVIVYICILGYLGYIPTRWLPTSNYLQAGL